MVTMARQHHDDSRMLPIFGNYVAQIWNDLREEASRGMREDETRRAGGAR